MEVRPARPLAMALSAAINLTSVGLSLTIRLLLARVMDQASFGLFSIWFNNLQLFGVLGTYGKQNHALRSLAKADGDGREKQVEEACSILRFSFVTALAAAIIAALFLFYAQGGTAGSAIWQAMAVYGFVLLTVLAAIHRSFGRLTLGISFDRIVPQFLFLLIIVFAMVAGLKLANAQALYTITLCIGLIASACFFVLWNKVRFSQLSGRVHFRSHLLESLPYFLLSLGLNVNGRYFLAIAGMFLSGELLGEIGILTTITSVILIPATTLALIAGPDIAGSFAENNPGHALRKVRLFLLGCAIGALLGALFALIAYEFAMRFIGFEMTLSVDVLIAAMVSMALIAMVQGVLFLHQMAGHAQRAVLPLLTICGVKILCALYLLHEVQVLELLLADCVLSLALLAVVLVQLIKILAKLDAST